MRDRWSGSNVPHSVRTWPSTCAPSGSSATPVTAGPATTRCALELGITYSKNPLITPMGSLSRSHREILGDDRCPFGHRRASREIGRSCDDSPSSVGSHERAARPAALDQAGRRQDSIDIRDG